MSEFSDSLHFFSISEPELKARLRDRGTRAFILNTDAPIAVLMGWEDKAKTRDIGASIDVSYAADHGLHCHFYNEGALVGRLNVAWGEDFGLDEEPADSPNQPGVSEALANELVRHFGLSEPSAERCVTLPSRYDFDDASQGESAVEELASLLGLRHFRWLSGSDLDHNIEGLVEMNPTGAVS